MKRMEDIEKLIKLGKPGVMTDKQMDKLTLDESFAVMEETICAKSHGSKLNISLLLKRTIIAVSASAAVIILAVGLLMIRSGKDKKVETTKVTRATQSPAEMLTLRSLKAAYYNGGIEAVEKQCDNAVEKLVLNSKRITIEELFADINGT